MARDVAKVFERIAQVVGEDAARYAAEIGQHNALPDYVDVPRCMGRESYRLWIESMVDGGDVVPICRDCSPAFQVGMQDVGRCKYAGKVKFVSKYGQPLQGWLKSEVPCGSTKEDD